MNSTRLTSQRKIVLDEVFSRCDHPTADMIYESIHKKYPSISKSTVYRNLAILSKEGTIKHLDFPNGDRYDLTTINHCHIRCTICGKVIDAPIKYQNSYDAKVSKETGYIIKQHNLVFEGICPKCQEKLKKGSNI